MTQLSDVVSFNEDLFFNGAVKIGWFESDIEKSRLAASHFVFHGPEYHGVSDDDSVADRKYALTDTAGFTRQIISAITTTDDKQNPFALAIAGYGTGKSHLGLTLSMLTSAPHSEISGNILANIESADPEIGKAIRSDLSQVSNPFLVVAINGMDDFDLSGEITRQILHQLKSANCDTAIIEELSPRFSMAANFVKRNFEIRQNEFIERFGESVSVDSICDLLASRNETTYSKVNEIFENANGYPIRAIGQESLQHLISTVTEHYCGDAGPFQSILIVFDEFGRYLEFAAEKPHVAGDSALQQLFEGVQENSDTCFLVCFIQYELKAYISRVSHEKRDTIKRYIGRYDSAKKYLLSTNLETLFAHLIQKEDSHFLSTYLTSSGAENDAKSLFDQLNKWLPHAGSHSVWNSYDLFEKVIYQGCWPLHPVATWFLCRLADTENELQQRSAISFINAAYQQMLGITLGQSEPPWSISAAQLCSNGLVEEMLSSEQSGNKSALAHAFVTIEQKYKHDLSDPQKNLLLSILIATKIGIKVEDQGEADIALGLLSGVALNGVRNDIENLTSDFGVIEWNDRFKRYELLSDSVPRSAFTAFLRRKTNQLSSDQIEDLFALHMKKWGEINDMDSDFGPQNNIKSVEWRFQLTCSHMGNIESAIDNAVTAWKEAIETDSYRGQMIYCYVSPERQLDEASEVVSRLLKKRLKTEGNSGKIPIFIALLHDTDGTLKQALSEYWILTTALSDEENEKFSHFIKNHTGYLFDEFKRIIDTLLRKKAYVYSQKFKIENTRLKKITFDLFDQSYPKILPFPFDGFSTARGNAAKDCREITAALIQGQLNHDWISTKPTQTRNRVNALLGKKRQGWGGLGNDGRIALLPDNQKVRFIIAAIEKEVKSKETVNIGAVFNSLIKPPFGCNIASAGLVIALFLAPRQDNTAILLHSEKVTASAWLTKVFKGNFLNTKVLAKSEIRFISETEASEWQRFLEDWDRETTHIGRVDFMTRAEELNREIPRPSHLYDRWERLDSQSESSSKLIKEFNDLLDYQEETIAKACEKENVPSLSWAARKINTFYKNMQSDESSWTSEEFEKVEQLRRMARTALVQFFDPWLPQQKIFKSQQIGDFRHKMLEQIGKSLISLELKDQHQALNAHVKKVISNIEELQKVQYIIEESQAFVKSHSVNPQSKVAEMNDWVKKCDELLKVLKKSQKKHEASEISDVIQRISNFQKLCRQQITDHKNRAAELYNAEFSSLEDVNQVATELQNIFYIFDGQQSDLEDFDIMQRQLAIFKNDMMSWADETISNDELTKKVEHRITETDEELNKIDEPVWDTDTAYRETLKRILQKRFERAEEWINGIYTTEDNIESMPAEKTQKLLNKLQFIPAYFNASQTEKMAVFKQMLEDRLEAMQIEGLIVKFRQMPVDMQHQFFELIKDELSLN